MENATIHGMAHVKSANFFVTKVQFTSCLYIFYKNRSHCQSWTLSVFAFFICASCFSMDSFDFQLFWISMMVAGFSMASYIIHQSFKLWESSPFATTVDILPISSLPIPDFTLCPPDTIALYRNQLNLTPSDEDLTNLYNSLKVNYLRSVYKEIVALEKKNSVKTKNIDGDDYMEIIKDKCRFEVDYPSGVFGYPAYFNKSWLGRINGCNYKINVVNNENQNLTFRLLFDNIDLGIGDTLTVFSNETLVKIYKSAIFDNRNEILDMDILPGKCTIRAKLSIFSGERRKGFLGAWKLFKRDKSGGLVPMVTEEAPMNDDQKELSTLLARYPENQILDTLFHHKVNTLNESSVLTVSEIIDELKKLLPNPKKFANTSLAEMDRRLPIKLSRRIQQLAAWKQTRSYQDFLKFIKQFSSTNLMDLLLKLFYQTGDTTSSHLTTIIAHSLKKMHNFYTSDLIYLLTRVNKRITRSYLNLEDCSNQFCDTNMKYELWSFIKER